MLHITRNDHWIQVSKILNEKCTICFHNTFEIRVIVLSLSDFSCEASSCSTAIAFPFSDFSCDTSSCSLAFSFCCFAISTLSSSTSRVGISSLQSAKCSVWSVTSSYFLIAEHFINHKPMKGFLLHLPYHVLWSRSAQIYLNWATFFLKWGSSYLRSAEFGQLHLAHSGRHKKLALLHCRLVSCCRLLVHNSQLDSVPSLLYFLQLSLRYRKIL